MNKERLEQLFRELENLKGYIDKGDSQAQNAVNEKMGEVTELLAHNEQLKKDYADVIAKHEQLENRVKWFEGLFAKSQKDVSVPGLEDYSKKFSMLKAMAAIHTGDWSDAGFEKEVFEETRKKANEGQVTYDNSAGGYLVPVEVSRDIIELVRPSSIAMTLGVSVLSGLSGGKWEVPAGKGGIQTYWVKEGVSLTESEEAFGQVSLTPKEVGALVRMTLQFAKRATPDAESYIRGRMAQELALEIDKAVFMGTGGDTQPLGLWNIPGLHELQLNSGNGAEFTLDDMIDLEGKLEDANTLVGKLALAMHPAIKRRLLKAKIAQYNGDTSGEPLFRKHDKSLIEEYIGYPISTTTQLPTNLGGSNNFSPIFFANWADVLLGQWGSFEIAAATQAGQAFEKRQMLMRITQEVDVAVARKESIAVVTDATVS